MNNANIIVDFNKAWKSKDIDSILDFFTDDATYTNIPMPPPNKGKAEIRSFISGFLDSVTEIEFIVHNQIEGANGIIMNERTDKINFNGKIIELPVMGIFKFESGKICAWRDYFDMKPFLS